MSIDDNDGSTATSEAVIDLRRWREASRYKRRSGALPHLADDPDYVPLSGGLPQPVTEPEGFLTRLRTRLAGS